MADSTYSFTQANNPSQLDSEIRASSLGSLFDGMATSGSAITTFFTQALTSDQQTTLAGIISSHVPSYVNQVIDGKLAGAVDFGTMLMNQFKRSNVLLGITQAGKTQLIADASHNLYHYLITGSLYAAINECDKMSVNVLISTWSPYITAANLEGYKNQIQTYLGIPLT